MKQLAFIFTVTLVPIVMFAQERTYKFKIGQVLQRYDIGTEQKGEKELIKDSYIFTLETIVEGNYIIWVLQFDDNLEYNGNRGSDLNAKLFREQTTSNPIYFFVPTTVWDQYVEEVFRSRGVTFGIMNAPMKLRFPNSNPDASKRLLELDANVNLGLSVAPFWRRGSGQILFTPIGISITQIKADPGSTSNYLGQTENRSGFSLFGGLVLHSVSDDFQIGVLIGFDWVTGDVSEHWVYQGKPWLGIGIGVGLFQPNNKPVKSQSP